MEPLAETGTGLASRATGIWALRFAFGRGAVPPECPTSLFAVAIDMADETAARLGGDTNDRPDPIDDLSTNSAIRSEEASKTRGDLDV
jgi:hypothetical protein